MAKKKSGKAKRGTAKKAARSRRAPTRKAKASRPAKRKAAAKRAPAKRPARKVAARRPDPIRELAQRIVELTSSGNDEATLALYADNVESVEMNQPPMFGIDAIKQKFQMWRGMTSSADFQARHVWVDGTTIIIEWDARCTLAASGKTVDLHEIGVHEIANGKIVRERFYYDPSVLQP